MMAFCGPSLLPANTLGATIFSSSQAAAARVNSALTVENSSRGLAPSDDPIPPDKRLLMNSGPLRVIDSHTAGEPTRTIVAGAPVPSGSSVSEWLADIRIHHDSIRRALVNEPRGSEVMVGAYLLPPADPANDAAVIFFNNVGYLGMCGHGMIGVIETLRYLGRAHIGTHRIETVAGTVEATLDDSKTVAIKNVPSYRSASKIPLATENFGIVHADIAYGGNWFCLAKSSLMDDFSTPYPTLLAKSQQVLAACRKLYPEVDHVELFGKPMHPTSHSRNFVLCPGAMYDRSPCGTGTSAKIACLAADGELEENALWVQEGVLGTAFQASFEWLDSSRTKVIPTIRGRAFVNADLQMIVDPADPFAWGIPNQAS